MIDKKRDYVTLMQQNEDLDYQVQSLLVVRDQILNEVEEAKREIESLKIGLALWRHKTEPYRGYVI